MMLRPALLIVLAACASTRAPAPPPSAPPATASDRPAAPAPAPAPVVAPVVTGTDPGFAFLDPDRRTKLTAAFAKVDAAVEDEMKKQDLPGLAIGIVIDGELAYAKGFGVTDLET